jgi:hypothetical protein
MDRWALPLQGQEAEAARRWEGLAVKFVEYMSVAIEQAGRAGS